MAGFRTALKQTVSGSAARSKCTGGSCFVHVPRDYNVLTSNTEATFPEYFISISTPDMGYFDGGIMARGEGEWSAFIYGGKAGSKYNKIWKEVKISNKDGQRVEIKFKGKKFSDGKYLCLYVDGQLVIKANRYDTNVMPGTGDPNGNGIIGSTIEAAADGGVFEVSHELNLVPKRGDLDYLYFSDMQGRAFFRNAKISEAIPVDDSGYPLSFSHSTLANCDDDKYPKTIINKCCLTSGWSSKGFTSSIDFNNA